MTESKGYHQEQIMLTPSNLEEKVSANHLARYISRAIDELDISDIEAGHSELGCHAYHPRTLLKVVVCGYSIGSRSSRRLQREPREDLVFM